MAGMGKASASTAAFGKQMTAFGAGMTKFVTLPLLALGAASAKFALDFEKPMTDLEALVGMTATEVAGFRKQILALAPAVGKGPRELGEAFYFIASSGLKGEAAMRALKASALAAAAGLGETMTVADAVTSAINAYGEKALSATTATDILVAAVREGKSEPEEFAASIGRVIPLASKMGVSFGEVAGMMAAMSLNGTDADEAVTQISATLSASIKPTKAGVAALAEIGMTYADLRNEIKTKGLTETIAMLDAAFQGNIETLGELFPNIRGLRGVLALTGASAEKYAGIIDEVARAHGDAAAAAAIALEKPGAKLAKAWAGIQADLIETGDVMLPMVANIAEEVAGLSKAFSGLSEGTKTWVVKLGLAAAAVGPLVLGIAKLLGVAHLAWGAVATLSATVTALSAAFSVGGAAAFGATLVASLGPIGLTIAAIAGVGGLVWGLYRLDKATEDTIATTKDLDRVLKALAAEGADDLQKWMDKKLGGHYVVKDGELVWEPEVLFKGDIKTPVVAKIHEAGVAERKAIKEEAVLTRIAAAKLRRDELVAIMAEEKGRVGKGAAPPSREFLAAQDELRKTVALLDELGVKHAALVARFKPIEIRAKIDDLRAGIKKAEAGLAGLKNLPPAKRTAEILLKEQAFRDKIGRLKGAIIGLTSKNWKVLIEADITKTKTHIRDMEGALLKLDAKKTTPKIEADKKILETAITKAKAELEKLQKQKTSPKIEVTDEATRQARAIRAGLVTLFAPPITQTIRVIKQGAADAAQAFGGSYLLNRPTSFLAGEAGGEIAAFFPLNDPRRSQEVLSQLSAQLARVFPSARAMATSAAPTAEPAAALSGGGDLVFKNCSFSAHTPCEIAEQVRAVWVAEARREARTGGLAFA